MTPNRWRWLLLAIKLLVAGGLCALLLWQGQLSFAGMGQLLLDPLALLEMFVLMMGVHTLAAIRWRWLLACQGIPFASWRAIQVYFISAAFNTFLPGGMGGDAVRVVYAVRAAPLQRTAAALSVVVDRLVGLMALMTLGLLGFALGLDRLAGHPALRIVAVGGTLATLLLLGGVGVMWWWLSRHAWRLQAALTDGAPWWQRLWRRSIEALRLYHQAPGTLARSLVLSLGIHLLLVVILLRAGHALGIGALDGADYLLVMPWSMLANALPISPGGLGVGEAAFSQLCDWMAGPNVEAPFGTIFFAVRLVLLVTTLPGVVFYLVYQRNAALAVTAADSEPA